MESVRADYASLCNNEKLYIQNKLLKLSIESCSEKMITFKLVREGNPVRKFDFDFRYYNPYKEGSLKRSGVYVFKTSDKDS